MHSIIICHILTFAGFERVKRRVPKVFPRGASGLVMGCMVFSMLVLACLRILGVIVRQIQCTCPVESRCLSREKLRKCQKSATPHSASGCHCLCDLLIKSTSPPQDQNNHYLLVNTKRNTPELSSHARYTETQENRRNARLASEACHTCTRKSLGRTCLKSQDSQSHDSFCKGRR